MASWAYVDGSIGRLLSPPPAPTARQSTLSPLFLSTPIPRRCDSLSMSLSHSTSPVPREWKLHVAARERGSGKQTSTEFPRGRVMRARRVRRGLGTRHTDRRRNFTTADYPGRDLKVKVIDTRTEGKSPRMGAQLICWSGGVWARRDDLAKSEPNERIIRRSLESRRRRRRRRWDACAQLVKSIFGCAQGVED